MGRRHTRNVSLLVALGIMVIPPAMVQAGTENPEIERCFKYEGDLLTGSIILQAEGETVQGAEFGTVRTADGETWGYSAVLNGNSVGGRLSLKQDIVVDGSVEARNVAWQLHGGMLNVNDDFAYSATSCAPLWTEFELRNLSGVTPIRPLSRRPGQLFSLELDNALTGFKPYEVGFALPADGVARAEFESDPFFAVILKSAPRCGFSEDDRLEIQKRFPNHKVFMSRFSCGENLELISYTNVSEENAFIAVLAGESRSSALDLLAEIKSEKSFPGANVREMRAVLIYP